MSNSFTRNNRWVSFKRPIDFLNAFEDDVEEGRTAYLAAIDKLPSSLRETASLHYNERLARANPAPLLGEYAPWLIADILGISDREPVRRIVSAWLQIYFFTMLLDDIIDDNSRSKTPEDLLTAMLLLQKGVAGLYAGTDVPKVLSDNYDSAFAETANAALTEFSQHRNRVKAFTSDDINNIGQKLAILKICVEAFSQISGETLDRKRWLHSVLSRLATGIQLLDDLTDWEEDLAQGNMTFLLTSSACDSDNYTGPVSGSQGVNQTLLNLLLSGALEKTIAAALRELLIVKKSLEDISIKTDSRTFLFVESLTCSCSEVQIVLRESRQSLVTLQCEDPSIEILREKILKRTKEALEIVSQGS